MPYLFDASSIILAMKLKKIGVLAGNCIQSLTIYEVLNALWKESSVLKKIGSREAENLVDVFAQLLRYLNTIDVRGVEGRVFRTAMETSLTVYDASYLVLAQREGLTLVTEDAKLRKMAGETVKAVSFIKLTQTQKRGSTENMQ